MLRYTMEKVQSLPAGNDWNAHFESFCTHARLLRDFVTNDKDSRNFKAKEFVDGCKDEPVPSHIVTIMQKIDSQVFHPGKRRSSKQEEKVYDSKVRQVYDWLETAIARFESTLEEPYKSVWTATLVAEDHRHSLLKKLDRQQPTTLWLFQPPSLPARTTWGLFGL